MGQFLCGGGGSSAQVKPDATPSTDIHHPAPSTEIHHPAEKNCPVCGASNYIEEMHRDVQCFKCKREGKITLVTRDGATGLKNADEFAEEKAEHYVEARQGHKMERMALNGGGTGGLTRATAAAASRVADGTQPGVPY